MTTKTITFRVDAAEHADLAARAERDKVSLSDYVRVRLGLRDEGPHDGGALAVAAADEGEMRACSPITSAALTRSKPTGTRAQAPTSRRRDRY